MSDPVDKHLDEAVSLDDLTVRELHATSEALERRKTARAPKSVRTRAKRTR